MSLKTNSIVVMFVVLIFILAVNPRIVNDIYSSILGRLFLVSIVIFFSMKSVTLGLLLILTIIAGLNQFGKFVEGFSDMPTTVGDDNVSIIGKQKVLTNNESEKLNNAKQKISELKANISSSGIDKEDIKNTIMSKDSKSIQLDPNVMKNENVEAFVQNMLKQSTLTEGFYSASPVF